MMMMDDPLSGEAESEPIPQTTHGCVRNSLEGTHLDVELLKSEFWPKTSKP